MAIINTIDLGEAEKQLGAWLPEQLPDAEDVRVSNLSMPSLNGVSSETILFDATWTQDGEERSEGLVARVEPAGERVLFTYDLPQEYRIMKALSENTEIPAPRVVAIEEASSVLGAPFLVMERIDGRIPPDQPPFTVEGWVLDDLDPEQRAAMHDNALGVLAAIHRVDWKALGLEFLARPELGEDSLAQQIAYYEQSFEWGTAGQRNPVIEAAFEWVRENRPTEVEPVVISWGDARPGNMIFADDLSVAGVLDWELATLASPELDLGWWLFVARHHSEGFGAPLPEGWPRAEQTIARYEELSGRDVRHAHFYEAFAGLRFSILMVRAGHMMIALGALPEGHPMPLNNPGTQLLAMILDLPAPEGEASSFLGSAAE